MKFLKKLFRRADDKSCQAFEAAHSSQLANLEKAITSGDCSTLAWIVLKEYYEVDAFDGYDFERRSRASEALRSAGDDGIEALALAVDSSSEEEADNLDEAVKLLVEIGDERAIDPLLKHFPCWKIHAVGGIAQDIVEFFARLNATEAAIGLAEHLTSEDSSVRIFSAMGVGLLCNKDTLPFIQDAYEIYPESIIDGLDRAKTEFADSILRELRASTTTSDVDFASVSDSEMIEKLRLLCAAYFGNDRAEINLLEPLASEIGEELNRRGGVVEMRRIFEEVGKIPGLRTLEMHWNGIGDWRG